MKKIKASIIKEILLLLNDKVGLFFMFFMPIILVFIITIIQNSAYEMINENKISLLVSNQDKGSLGDSLVTLLGNSKMFALENVNLKSKEELNTYLLKNKKLTGLYIPANFSTFIEKKSAYSSGIMLNQIGLNEEKPIHENLHSTIELVYDPVLQDNYVKSIEGIVFQSISIVENTHFIQKIYTDLGVETENESLKNAVMTNNIEIVTSHAQLKKSNFSKKPNATEHNVPAWTIFAMFFMVVSLANNIVKEKNNGSFIRLKTISGSISHALLSKMLVFVTASFMQVFIIFSIGLLIFPKIGLPKLHIQASFVAIFLVVLLTSLAAISWAFLIGAFAKTQEQAGGIGAISIIIFAALGGIWVPTFAMPKFMQMISKLSPMNWCLESFYTLLLKNGSLKELLFIFAYLVLFIVIMQGLSLYKLKKEKII
jgi:ABC-2 type transport system permease protein